MKRQLCKVLVLAATGATLLAATTPAAEDAGLLAEFRCHRNLEKISSALESYSSDHAGHYPTKLAELSPAYLKALPGCPKTGTDTYSSAYRASTGPDAYTFFCQGNNHAEVGEKPDQPAYSSSVGLITAVDTWRRARPGSPLGHLLKCEAGQRKIGMALVRYSGDHQDHFPASLSLLVPKYLTAPPTCPVSDGQAYSVELRPDSFTVSCRGAHHADMGLAPGYPQYSSARLTVEESGL